MNLLQRMARRSVYPLGDVDTVPWGDASPWGSVLGGGTFPYPYLRQTLANPKQEGLAENFQGLVQGAYRRNGVVFAVELARIMLFAQARFQYQRLVRGRPGDLFGDASLGPLEHPWDGGTTGDLLTRMLQDNDFGGDAFVIRRGDKLRRARPDWVTLVLGSYDDPEVMGEDIDADVLGLLYHPGGYTSGREPQVYLGKRTVGSRTFQSEFAHFALIPDPLGFRRGISWVSAIAPNVQSHSAATAHKLAFFNNGATVNMVVNNVPGTTPDQFQDWINKFEEGHKGLARAYKTLYLSGATTATPVGLDFEKMAFRELQGLDEVTICNAGGVPATVIGISDGLQGSSLNAGNYGSAMRRFGDMMARPAWQNAASSLEAIVPPPSGGRLWYDARDIPALADDIKDAAEVQSLEATQIRGLLDAGFEADAVIDAVVAGDLARLKGKHTGLFSVQLQAPGSTNMPAGEVEGEVPVAGGDKPAKPDPIALLAQITAPASKGANPT